MQLTIESELLDGLSEADVLRELAVGLYQQQKIGLMPALKLSGLSKTEFWLLLRERGLEIDWGYEVEDLSEDVQALNRLFASHDRRQ